MTAAEMTSGIEILACPCSCCAEQVNRELHGRTDRWCTCPDHPQQERCDCAHCDHPDVRTCRHCGHKRDEHGAYRASNGGWRCSRLATGCGCPGFQPALSDRSAS